jgi:hypothetical protein
MCDSKKWQQDVLEPVDRYATRPSSLSPVRSAGGNNDKVLMASGARLQQASRPYADDSNKLAGRARMAGGHARSYSLSAKSAKGTRSATRAVTTAPVAEPWEFSENAWTLSCLSFMRRFLACHGNSTQIQTTLDKTNPNNS